MPQLLTPRLIPHFACTCRAIILFALATVCMAARAQQFKVRSFRQLPNDISAYINPVRDLNGEACALLKVVGDAAFAFSSPLGIVERRDDVGEIWIYLPHGSRLLTLKHPQWGVMRDYRFSAPLESRMTYELVVSPIIDAPQAERVMPPVDGTAVFYYPSSVPPLPVAPSGIPFPRRPREKLRFMVLAQAGFGRGNNPSLGIRLAVMRRHGAYVQLSTDLHGMHSTDGECDRDGTLADGSGATPYYTGATADARRSVLAGGIHCIAGGLCLYEGIGYGERRVAWQMSEEGYVRNTGYSVKGICAEAGMVYRFRNRLAVSAGVQTIGFDYWEGTVGIGVCF